MKRALKLTVALDLIFLLLLSVSGSLSGVVSEVLYYGAFLIPVLLAFVLEMGDAAQSPNKQSKELFTMLRIKKKDSSAVLTILPLVIGVVLAISFLTSLFLNSLGVTDAPVPDEPILVMLLRHAALPAILEELLFRLVPMLLMAKYSRRGCVVWSSLFFALIHCNLFQIPYAFVAGVIFMSVNLATGSVIPSLVLHFLSNSASVVWLKYCKSRLAMSVYISVLFALCILSVLVIAIKRKEYKERIKYALDGEVGAYVYPLAIVIPTLIAAVLNALSL